MDPIWNIMDEQGRRLTWLARKTGYTVETVSRVKNRRNPASFEFQQRCAAALVLPVDQLFLCPLRSDGERRIRSRTECEVA